MPEATVSRDAHPLEMIEAMTRCAHDLGIAAAGIAQRAADDDTAGFLAASAEFRHCFFAVRMGVRLAQAARAVARAAAPVERFEREPPERERPEAAEVPERDDWRDDARLETERDREGDYEPISLPQVLRTLRGVAVRADQQRDDLPAHVRDTILPTLQGLLRQAKATPEGGAGRNAALAVAVLARPPALPAGRSRLLTSTVTLGVPPPGSKTPGRRASG